MTTSIRFQIKTPYIARYDSIYGVWWTGVDSNHRKLSWQIYSLLPLATLEPVHINVRALLWSRRWDLNPQPTDYKSVALPIELLRRKSRLWCLGAESNHRHRDFQSLALPTELSGQTFAIKTCHCVLCFFSKHSVLHFVAHSFHKMTSILRMSLRTSLTLSKKVWRPGRGSNPRPLA